MLSTLLAIAIVTPTPSPTPSDIMPKSNGCRIEAVTPDGRAYTTDWDRNPTSDKTKAEVARLKKLYPTARIIRVCI